MIMNVTAAARRCTHRLRRTLGLGLHLFTLSVGLHDGGAALALLRQLQLHRRTNVRRRHNLEDLYARDLQTPVETDGANARHHPAVNLFARGERVVESHVSDDRAQRRLHQLLDAVRYVVRLV